jgi:Fe2+ or Zn2+ uptake regulation protein
MRSSEEQRLREAGLRITRPRLTVLSVLGDAQEAGEHLPVSDIVRATRTRLGDVSTQAVYDCLEALSRAGLVRRVETAGSPARYEARVGDNHHHLVCRGCGYTVDVDCVVGEAPCLQPSNSHGFDIDEAEVVFWGVCPSCATATADAG